MEKHQLLKTFFLILGGSALAAAGTICPAGSGSNPFLHSPDNAATGCNVVITIAANGTISTQVTDSEAYEESEDALIGIKNNGTTPLTSINLSGSGIFGFDGDGICTFTFVGSSYCTASQTSGVDPGDYQGPTSTFTNFSSGNTGTVNFSPAVPANGGSTYFSLEGVPTGNLAPTTGPSATPTPTASVTPAPSSLVLTLIAFAGLGFFTLSHRLARSRS
jgi:hypothetical protein